MYVRYIPVFILFKSYLGLKVSSSFYQLISSQQTTYHSFIHHILWSITLFRSITMLCGTDNILWNILHIQTECGESSAKYCQSHQKLLWIWIILWRVGNRQIRFVWFSKSNTYDLRRICLQLMSVFISSQSPPALQLYMKGAVSKNVAGNRPSSHIAN